MSGLRFAILFAAGLAASASGAVTDAPAAAPAEPAPPVAKMICKSHVETGSLVSRKRTCLTRDQWKYTNEQNEASARRMVEQNTGRATSQ